MPSIRDRLKKVPPFDDDIPMMAEVKKIAQQQSSYVPQEEPAEPEEVEEEVVESPQELPQTPPPSPTEEETPPQAQETTPPPVEEPKDRTTEQFEKLKESNNQLKEENTKLYKNVMESLRPEAPAQEFTQQVMQQVEKVTTELPQDKVDDIYANLIDKDGYIDPDLLVKTLKEANREAMYARQQAEEAKREAEAARQETKRTMRDFEEDKEVRKVHRKYPQIDPKNLDKFNEHFWDDVRKEIATAPILKGTTPTFMEAADLIWNDRYAGKEEVKEVNKKDVKEVEDAKKQINASTQTGRPSNYYAPTDQEVLRQGIIHGKKGALAEKLRQLGQ